MWISGSSMECPEPVIELAIEPKTKAGQGKMGEALAKLAEEDPTFRAHTNQETGQTIIAGMGELHLEIIVDRLLREFHVEANVGAPQVAYKEAFTLFLTIKGCRINLNILNILKFNTVLNFKCKVITRNMRIVCRV